MTYGIIFLGNPPIELKYLECRKEQLGLIWGVVTENLVETCLKN
jgi:hypothetical protein